MTCAKCPAQLWGYEVTEGQTLCRTCRKGPARVRKVDHDAEAAALVAEATAAAKSEAQVTSRHLTEDPDPDYARTLELMDRARPQSRVQGVQRVRGVSGCGCITQPTPVDGVKVSKYLPGRAQDLKPKRQSGDRGWVQGEYSSDRAAVKPYAAQQVERTLKGWR